MKKLRNLLLCLALVFSLTACKKENTPHHQEDPIIEENSKQEESIKEEENKTEQKQEETPAPSVEEEKKEELPQKKEEIKKEEPKKEEVKPTPNPPATTNQPLKNKGRIVVLDAGHGGPDPGCSNNGYLEKNITLDYTLTIGQILASKGVQVIYTRVNDQILKTDSYRMQDGTLMTNDLRARAELGETQNAALYVSIHVDSIFNYAKGYSIYAHTSHPDSMALANSINTELKNLNYTTSKGVLNGSALRVIRCNTTISCLVELGYITGDLDILLDPNQKQQISNAIATGIINKLNAGWIEPNLVLEKQPDLY